MQSGMGEGWLSDMNGATKGTLMEQLHAIKWEGAG